ncbi:DUF3137 domain-containing protein [Oceanobacillus manasiensis]|uniref:DUF3137 domain-containing protein n=1 Tax=Oceanobacillus manasiensis TaxID=586413 RepID=UPI0005A756F1|nr:DUF3137 domain-containing protein [Oceanobacillus manasiensis]
MKKVDEVYQLERFAKSEKEFDVYYEENLRSEVERLEEERLNTMDLIKKQAMKLLPGIVLLILCYLLLPEVSAYLFAATILYAGYLFKEVKRKRRELAKKIKEEIVTDIVTFLNKNFTYTPRKYISQQVFMRSNIFGINPNRYTGEDLIKGTVGSESEDSERLEKNPPKTDLSFCEISASHAVRYKDKDGKTKQRIQPIFNGLFFVAEFNKDFDGLTIIGPKKDRTFAKREKSQERGKLEDVELEDIQFMDEFLVRTTDQITARYILTPNFMNRLLSFTTKDRTSNSPAPTTAKEAFQMGLNIKNSPQATFSKTPYFAFKNGKMYFMLPTERKHFDFNLYLPLNKEVMKGYFHDINIALELVDELNLNLRIWNKA